MLVTFDSNVLINAYNRKSPLHKKAKDLLAAAASNKIQAAITPQNAFEFYSIATTYNKNPADKTKIKKLMLNYLFSDIFTLIIPNSKTIFFLDTIIKNRPLKPGPHIYDLFLAATLLSHGTTTLYTQNSKDFAGIKGFQAINPFTPSSPKI